MAKAPGSQKRPASGKAAKGGSFAVSSGAGGEGQPVDAATEQDPEALPGPDEIAALLQPVRDFMHGERFARVRGALAALAQRPPQVLLLEGGTVFERMAAAHYWALQLNCRTLHPLPQRTEEQNMLPLIPGMGGGDRGPQADEETGRAAVKGGKGAQPCLECAECIRMVTHLHRDCFFLDGTAASIKIDDVRGIRSLLGEPPRDAEFRMVIFREAQALAEAAANALLKSFEEPNPQTSFVLLAPQRERLLPTLVSRSVALTLPWPPSRGEDTPDELIPWEAALCTFLQSGRGWFERTGTKGNIDAPTAHAILNLCRRALAARMVALQSGDTPKEGLEELFARLPAQRLRMLDEVLAECQESLLYNVNPVLVMEWLATRLYLLMLR